MLEKIGMRISEEITYKGSRLLSVDALRGLIIIFMALDHANYFVSHKHSPGEYWGDGFPLYYDALAFLTRFVTHPSAPGFFFLMGVGMLLFANSRRKSGWSEWAIMRHFWIRGGVLMALQLLVVNRAWELSPGGGGTNIYIGVLFALGGAMIISSFLLWLKPSYLIGLALVLLVGTELLVPDPSLWGQFKVENILDALKHILIFPGGDNNLWSNYPILPWLELVVFGMAFGYWLVEDSKKAFKRGVVIGGVLLACFVIIRYLDGFGNIRPRMGNDWMDYLNVVKYPPSISFTLLTMGINLLLLWSFSQVTEKVKIIPRVLAVYGQAPLFFYVLHLFLYAGLGAWLTPEGTSIPAMYPYWLFGLLLLFPMTLWFGAFKRQQPVKSPLRFL